ncbi:hypothetical protein LOK49_LG03G01419 [Camellia lanceoleosa]|uniref:Uncharacterized protein n=1 Tax=Camellia lanceoleosa TaxID=1840588 RepID=A0ACC0IAR8_9ERIC|nr:hypothetical protein LOK49_LG03G01419 [Camellia lanceoleosa]
MELIENREEGDQEKPVEDDADSTNRVVPSRQQIPAAMHHHLQVYDIVLHLTSDCFEEAMILATKWDRFVFHSQ